MLKRVLLIAGVALLVVAVTNRFSIPFVSKTSV